MYDWLIWYGEPQTCFMRSGYKYPTEDKAKLEGEDFARRTAGSFMRQPEPYPNNRIEVIKLKDDDVAVYLMKKYGLEDSYVASLTEISEERVAQLREKM